MKKPIDIDENPENADWLKDLKRREPTQEGRDTDTALHEIEMGMDRPGSPEFLERLREQVRDWGLDPDVLIQD